MDQEFKVGGFYAFQIQPTENSAQISVDKFGILNSYNTHPHKVLAA